MITIMSTIVITFMVRIIVLVKRRSGMKDEAVATSVIKIVKRSGSNMTK